MSAALFAGMAKRAERRAEAAVAARTVTVAAAIGATFPEIEVSGGMAAGQLVLRAPGLAVRSRGTRRWMPDARLAMLAAWLAAEGRTG